MSSPSTSARRLVDVRAHNLALVMHEVHLRGEVSRAELTARSGLNRSTIAGLVTALADLGLVVDRRPTGGAKAGRPSHLVAARDDGPFTIAVELDVGRVVVALVGLGGAVLARIDGELPDAVAVEVEVAVDAVDRAVERLVTLAPAGSRPAGVGVSVAGTVRLADGLVRSAPNLGWVDVPLARLLGERLRRRYPGLGVRVGNDGDLGARAEHLRGAARNVDDVVYLAGHVGVGGGIISGGTALTGARGFSGEFGHMVISLDGPPCRCGGSGCFEALVGGAALCRLAGPGYRAGSEGTARVLADSRSGPGPAGDAVRVVAGRLGSGLATIVNVLDPRMIVVGGVLEQVLRQCGGEVDASMGRQLTPAARAAVTVCTSGLGDDSSLLGAAELGYDELLDSIVERRRWPREPARAGR